MVVDMETVVICNQCGKKMLEKDGILKEGCVRIRNRFGYFSKRDGVTHSFNLCEPCYDQLISGFSVPVKEEEDRELL